MVGFLEKELEVYNINNQRIANVGQVFVGVKESLTGLVMGEVSALLSL